MMLERLKTDNQTGKKKSTIQYMNINQKIRRKEMIDDIVRRKLEEIE